MRMIASHVAAGLAILLFAGCGSSNTQKPPAEIPEICRFVDLKDPQMAEICGLRTDRSRAYRNIPQMRFLAQPKGGALALVDGKVELRLPNMLPVNLGDTLAKAIDFSDRAKRDFVKNSYDYHEIYPQPSTRLRLFQLTIPVIGGAQVPFCFSMPDRVVDERRKEFGGHDVQRMECQEMQRLVQVDSKDNAVTVTADPVSLSSSATVKSPVSSSSQGSKRRVKR